AQAGGAAAGAARAPRKSSLGKIIARGRRRRPLRQQPDAAHRRRHRELRHLGRNLRCLAPGLRRAPGDAGDLNYPCAMQVRVLFFGMLKDAAGRAFDTLQLPERATLADLLDSCGKKFPALPKFFGSLALSVNQEYAGRGTVLRENDEVALLPPVSGGSVQAEIAEAAHVQLVRDLIVPHNIVPS